MKLIYNMVLVDVKNEDNDGIIINMLNGNICVVSKEEKEYIREWQNAEYVDPVNECEKELFENMLEGGYLVTNSDEEEKIVEQIFAMCRKNYERVIENRKGVVFVITYKCNFACPYCYENAISYSEDKILSKEMVDKIFQLHNNSIMQIALYGGEPFLPETREIIEYIISKAPNAVYSATTNGYYLTEFIDMLKTIKVSNIMITLDGPKEIHNRTRILKNGDGTYDQVERSIVACLRNSIPIKLRMNVSERNMKDCLELRDEYIMRFQKDYEAGILMFELQPIFQIEAKVRDRMNEKLYYQGAKVEGNPFKYNMMTHSVSPILKTFVYNSKKAFKPRYCSCDAEGKRLFYDAEGYIYSCILSLRNKVAAVGKFYPDYYMKESSILTRNIESVEECKRCKLKFLCGGGCAYGIIESDGNVMKPNCAAIINEIYSELPRLYTKLIKEKL